MADGGKDRSDLSVGGQDGPVLKVSDSRQQIQGFAAGSTN